MTLIVAIPAKDGIAFASDGQVTTGALRATGTKVRRLSNQALWAASGELALIQRVAEKLDAHPRKDQPLLAIRDEIAVMVKDSVTALLTMDFRTPFFNQRPDDLLELHQGDFLFVEHRNGRSAILHIMSHGIPEWIEERCAASGSGSLFAHTLLAKYASLVPLSRDKAKLLAYKVIEEAILVDAYGLGPPIDIWEVSAGGAVQAAREEVQALEDSAEVLRDAEVRVFGDEPPPAAGAAPAPAPPPGGPQGP